MFEFFKSYQKWEHLSIEDKKDTLQNCVEFYESKTLSYILAFLPEEKRVKFVKEPVQLRFTTTQTAGQDVSFADNVVMVFSTKILSGDKKNLFFDVAKNTICAVFLNLFNSTANTSSKKTKFGELANGYFASITSEFGEGQQFEQDMMAVCSEVLSESVEMTTSK
ncbi:MAG: hypothetical protein EOM55_01220 [Clostridia bacterium]|nr:hypothetical protein [Clostridia bacterium]